jgi:protein YIPF1/2
VEISVENERSKPESDQDFVNRPYKEVEDFKQEQPSGCTKYCKLDYYKQYFDIGEPEVISRLKSAVIIPHTSDFIARTSGKPDFYGPFWVLTTLILLLGVIGNLANYLLSKFSS